MGAIDGASISNTIVAFLERKIYHRGPAVPVLGGAAHLLLVALLLGVAAFGLRGAVGAARS